MRKKRIRAAKKRTPPAMPTPRPTLRPVFEGLDEEEVPLSKGELEFAEDVAGIDVAGVVDVAGVEVGVTLAGALEVGAVLLVDGGVDEADVVAVDPTYSTVVGTDAKTWAVVVGV
jgi:hypothetical protein